MKEIRAIIRPQKLPRLREALRALPGFPGMTGSKAFGCGSTVRHTPHNIKQELVDFTEKVRVEIIATDEITQAADSAAIAAAAACGCTFLATAHGDGPADLHSRPAYRELLAAGVFRRLITIDCRGGAREYAVRELGL